MGAQTTSTRELRRLAKAAERLGCEFIQVSCPFYFLHTEEDFYEYVCEAADAADIGIILYNTFWTSLGRLVLAGRAPGRAGAGPGRAEMGLPAHRRHGVRGRRQHLLPRSLTLIDNHLMFAISAMLGAKAFEVHLANYWPEWGIKLIDAVDAGRWQEIQRMLVEEAMPFYKLWVEIEKGYTSGDGYLDKLCMELVGLDSSRCRPPTRDVRELYRDRCRQMMLATGVPGLVPA